MANPLSYLDDVLRVLRGTSGRTTTLPLRSLERKPHGLYRTSPNFPISRWKPEPGKTLEPIEESVLRELFDVDSTDPMAIRGIAKKLGISEKVVQQILRNNIEEIGPRAYIGPRSHRGALQDLPKTAPGFPRMMDRHGLLSEERESMNRFLDRGRQVGSRQALEEDPRFGMFAQPEEQAYLRTQTGPHERGDDFLELTKPMTNPQLSPGTVPSKEEQLILELLIEQDQNINRAHGALKKLHIDPLDADMPGVPETAWKYR